MIFTETKLKGSFIVDIEPIRDDRGFFSRSFCQREFEKYKLNPNVVQTNVSSNKEKGTLRGMHIQFAPFEETKLVRCTRGRIYDVIVDLRTNSETFRQWVGVELSADSYRMLFVPEGFAHGFITLENNTDVTYQVSQFYTPLAEQGYRWNDPAFNIEWPMEPYIVSQKDRSHSLFKPVVEI